MYMDTLAALLMIIREYILYNAGPPTGKPKILMRLPSRPTFDALTPRFS